MRLSTEVIIPGIDDAQTLEVEVENDVISFYLTKKDKPDFEMDFEGNFDEFIMAIMKVWGGWSETKKSDEAKRLE